MGQLGAAPTAVIAPPGGYTTCMMGLRTLARPMLAGMFVYGGLDAFRNPASKAPRAEKVAPPVADAVGLHASTEDLVRVNGAVQVVGGLALALGVLPRLAATALAASLVPTTLAGHRFWEETEAPAKANQTIQFLKNAAMMGGLLLTVDGG